MAAILTLKKCDDSETEIHLDILAIKTNEQKFPFQKFFGKEKLLKNIMKSVSHQPLISGNTVRRTANKAYIHDTLYLTHYNTTKLQ